MTFTSALRTFFAAGSGCDYAGEIRDADTAQMAIRGSLTGHLIFSTIHTNSAWEVFPFDRYGGSSLSDFRYVDFMYGATSVRLLCPECKREIEPDEHAKRLLGAIFNRVNYIGPWGANIVTTRDIVDVKLFMK